jgi:hypothetical protein
MLFDGLDYQALSATKTGTIAEVSLPAEGVPYTHGKG